MADDDAPLDWFGVRCIFEMRKGPSWTPRDDGLNEYEERITLWRAPSFEDAIAKAETEAREYAAVIEIEYLGLAQAYLIAHGEEEDDVDVPREMRGPPTEGTEVFSLIRVHALPPSEYLDAYFDTGTEYQGTYRNHQAHE